MRKIIEHQPADRNLLDIKHSRSSKKMLQRRVRRMERQRNKSLEAPSLILQSAQFEQVIDAICIVLDVPVQHRGIRFQPNLMRHPRRIEPLIAVNLVIANNMPHPVSKNFRPATRQRIHTRFFHLYQRLANTQLGPLRQVSNLHHGESLHVDQRKTLLQPRNQIKKILERQIRMQPANNMKLRNRFAISRRRSLKSLVQRHGVSARRVLLTPKSAQPASRHANIRRINMPVDVEVSLVPMHPLANPISQPTHGKNIARPVKHKRISLVQALASKNLIFNREQPRVVSLEWVRVRHQFLGISFYDNPARRRSLKSCHPERSVDFTKSSPGEVEGPPRLAIAMVSR